MRRLILLAGLSIAIFSCEKNGDEPRHCEYCYLVYTDSITGQFIKNEYGATEAATTYCDGALEQFNKNYPSYSHWVFLLPQSGPGHQRPKYSKTQKVTAVCE